MPNILLIVFDTARADVFEPYGAPAGTTPSVAQLAASGTAHPAAYAAASWTVPSHAALFSGLLPRTAGIHLGGQTPASFRQVMGGLEPRLLPAVLARAGYRTVGISANGWVTKHSGFDVGFETFRHITSGRHARLGRTTRRSRLHWAVDGLRATLDDGAAEIEQILPTTWTDRPFFCFVNLVECHTPYLPPRPFNPLTWRERLRSVRDANRYCTFEAMTRSALGVADLPPSESTARMRELYDGSIRQLDAWLGRILTTLDEGRLLADTQVIVTSDHGENFGEGGLMGHSFSLDDRLLRVPFVTGGPIDLGPRHVMSLAEVPGLIGDAVGLADHPWTEKPPEEGVAVAQFSAPAGWEDEAARSVIREWGLDPAGQTTLCRSFECATDGRLKLLRDADGEQLVDLSLDPLERHPTEVQQTTRHPDREAVLSLRRALDAADASEKREIPEVATNGAGSHGSAEDAALIAQMELLGYL